MPKTKTARGRLDRDRILSVAIEFADAHGIDKLNMRVLATQLDSAVMSLYTYVRNKEELLDAMVSSVALEIRQPDAHQPWREAVTEIAHSAFKTFYRHPWVNGLWARSASPAKLAHQESILRVLREAGFSVELACRGYHAITMHTIGFTMQALDLPRDAPSLKAAAEAFLAKADTENIPYFVEHMRHHARHPEIDGAFSFALDFILDGLEKLLEEA